jgi:CRP/FNR family transcriptional regulator
MEDVVAKKLKTFFSRFKYQTYRKGEILVRADDEPAGIFYLTKGHVKTYLITAKGDEIVLNVFKPISFFPLSGVMNKTKNSYYYEAMTELVLWRAPKEDVLEFLKNNPDVLYDLLSRVYRGLDGILTRMAYLMSGNAHARLTAELLIAAKRFGKKNEMNEISLSISETDLSMQAGLTRETVSREMKVLKDKRLVSLKKSVLTIQDIKSLEDELMKY